MRDIDIRRALREEINRLHGSDPETRTVEELGLCQGSVRVDIAVVNGTIHGYEIKSEHDTLVRLAGQSAVYSQALDLVTIVTALPHSLKIAALVPKWWGIQTAIQHRGEICLETIREAHKNPRISPSAQVQLLWRGEALSALESRGLATGMRNKARSQLWNRLATELTVDELGAIVRDALKKRRDWRAVLQQA
jgi:hypothetical protein